jgi:hypothetical protein
MYDTSTRIVEPTLHKNETAETIRIMYHMIAYTYNLKFDHQAHVVQNIRDMCEAGMDMELHIHTAEEDTSSFERITAHGILYCERIQANVNVQIHQYRKDIGDRLPCQPRDMIAERINDFNYFIVTEDDIDIRASHILARIRLEKQVQQDIPLGYQAYTGWIIYDQDTLGQAFSSWGTAGVTPKTFGELKKVGKHYYHVDPPDYQCGFFLSRAQLKHLIDGQMWSNKFTELTIFKTPDGSPPMYPRERCLGLYFMSRQFGHFVVPVEDIRAIMVNHLTNKYAPDMHHDPPIRMEAQKFLDFYKFEWDEKSQRHVYKHG